MLTASSETGIAEQDWKALAQPGQVLAIYMGIHAAGRSWLHSCWTNGIAPATPVTLVENGTLPIERVLHTTIGQLWDTVQTRGIIGPAMIYVGLAKAKASADIVPFPVREDIRDAILRAAS